MNKRDQAASDRLKRKYGIALHEYDYRLKLQMGRCAICGREPGKRRLDVDHDHKTKKVRGLLCHRCNRGLPWFSDDPGVLRSAAHYLELKVGLK
jgi:hypothetical protein